MCLIFACRAARTHPLTPWNEKMKNENGNSELFYWLHLFSYFFVKEFPVWVEKSENRVISPKPTGLSLCSRLTSNLRVHRLHHLQTHPNTSIFLVIICVYMYTDVYCMYIYIFIHIPYLYLFTISPSYPRCIPIVFAISESLNTITINYGRFNIPIVFKIPTGPFTSYKFYIYI